MVNARVYSLYNLNCGGCLAQKWIAASLRPFEFSANTARVMLGIDPQPQMQLRQQAENEIRFVTEELLRIYPNPAQNDVRLALEGLAEAQATYSILDINGRKVAQGMIDVYDGFGHIALNSLPNGVYVLQVQANNALHQTKLVIVKP